MLHGAGLFTEGGVHSYASDLYALGCVLYECCVGKPPFVSNSLTELMEMILNDDPPPLFNGERAREVGESSAGGGSAVGPDPPTPALADLITGLLEKDPARRLDWNAVLRHPFWRESGTGSCAEDLLTLASHPLPPQPAFQTYLAASGTSGRAEVVAHVSDRLAALTTSSSASPAGSSTGPNQQRGRGKEGGGGGGDENASPGSGGGGRRRTSSSGFTHQTHLSPSSREALRMSVNARANLEREGAGAYASRTPEKRRSSTEEGGAAGGGDPSPGPGASDVELADTDAELNFADATRDDGGVNDGGVNDREHNRSRPASADPPATSTRRCPGSGPLAWVGERATEVFWTKRKMGRRRMGTGTFLGDAGDRRARAGTRRLAATTTDESTARTPPPIRNPSGRGASGIDRVDSLPSPAAAPPGVGLASSRATFANRLVESRSLSVPVTRLLGDAQSERRDERRRGRAARDTCAELSDHPSDSQVKPIVLNRRMKPCPSRTTTRTRCPLSRWRCRYARRAAAGPGEVSHADLQVRGALVAHQREG